MSDSVGRFRWQCNDTRYTSSRNKHTNILQDTINKPSIWAGLINPANKLLTADDCSQFSRQRQWYWVQDWAGISEELLRAVAEASVFTTLTYRTPNSQLFCCTESTVGEQTTSSWAAFDLLNQQQQKCTKGNLDLYLCFKSPPVQCNLNLFSSKHTPGKPGLLVK